MRKIFVVTALITLLLTSCNSEPSLQKYFVKKGETKNFVTLDIAPNFVNSDKISLTTEEKDALESLKKLNVLIFKKDSIDTGLYKTEKQNVNELLKKEQYEELMRVGSSKRGVSIYTVGEEDVVDEFVLFIHQQENGFGVVRILGDDMNSNSIMPIIGLMQKGNLNLEQLRPLQDIMKG